MTRSAAENDHGGRELQHDAGREGGRIVAGGVPYEAEQCRAEREGYLRKAAAEPDHQPE